ncbi:DUF3422 family protein [Falsiroseomonas selenitidurans]|uniref:DUF3422 domain-containing protein n=1 Tax=Falsiroseomonas selenitidurans TaxID=2716335 RepID=A0ABX1EA49_9PROT|nr:DUF3422 domain-containing protein [Falsiroseomonas selenitidurans]NKC32637.1 DUF3422 domain-containing protein [Falsiroseomonas selenitidurans]
MIQHLPPHPQRDRLTGELHARPPLPLAAPVAISRLALVGEPGSDRGAAVAHLALLCQRYGVTPPAAGADFVLADFGGFRLRYERHTEFDGWTFLRPIFEPEADDPFATTAIAAVPRDWLSALPGLTLVAAHIAVLPTAGEDEPPPPGCFAPDNLAGATLSGGAATAWTDFRSGPDGFTRILLQDHARNASLTGRLAQALWEIETYRMFALLALPPARAASPELARASERLAALTTRLSGLEELDAEREALEELTELATGIEQLAAATADRFSAGQAYHALVGRRLLVLRETRLHGLPTLAEYLERRLDPAMATVEATRARIASLSVRCGRAVDLLRARVAVAQEAQTQKLLAAMAETGRAQLRLQETVEGLSVAGISYYVLSLAGYALKPLPWGLAGVGVDHVLALLVPLVAALVWLRMRRQRRQAAATG